MVTWSKQELLKLIDNWAGDRIQSELEVCHQEVYCCISRKICEAKCDGTFKQCLEKIKKFKK